MIDTDRAASESSGGSRVKRLIIGAGSMQQVIVYDIRDLGPWAEPTRRMEVRPHRFVYHHTASPSPDVRSLKTQITRLELLRNGSPWGLPYNFVVEAFRPWRIWYLNDVDQAWPHTYGGNDAVAIAAWGNFEEDDATRSLALRMGRLADALAVMWGEQIPEHIHRQFTATACPGKSLIELLVTNRDISPVQ